MLLRRSRYVQILPLLCSLTLAFPTQTPSSYDEVRQLQVNIPHSGVVSAPLGSSISIPCLVSLSSIASSSSSSPPVVPRVKWTVVSGGVETQILVARGQRVKVNELYRDRAALLNYTSTPDDLSLWLGDLRSSDSGHYRCEVQQGLEDASDLAQLKVKGVVFHYRDALGRYAFSFHQARRACEAIGAQIATPDQLLASYYDGYEQCDAGWLADQSVRYPIQVPREGCYGDMDGQPGVRNYGTMDPDDLFDVYCYVEQIDGEVFHDFIPQQISFNEAQSYCRAAGAELATTAQLYSAWSEGLDRCSPGWLSDGSVRYPIITPRERCGGVQAGVKTIYRFSNQTGFPEPTSLHDVYCFRDNRNTSTDSPLDFMATEAEDIGQNVIILLEKDQELQMNQQTEHVEREAQSVLESLPFFSVPSSTEENLVDTHPTVTSDTTESHLNSTSTLDVLQPSGGTSPTEPSYDSILMNSTISSTDVTDSHQNFTFHQLELDETTAGPHTQNQTVQDANEDVKTLQSEELKEMQEAEFDLNASQANYSETESNHTQEESFWEATSDPVVQVKLEEAREDDDDVQITLTTQASKEEEGALLTQAAQTNRSTIEAATSLWAHMDGSGDTLQESDLDVASVTIMSTTDSSTSSFTTHPFPLASTSSVSSEPRTTSPDPTLSTGTHHSEKLDVFSTVSQLWESISRQEGSTSLEAEDTLNMEIEEKQLYTTTSTDQLVSGVSLATTESLEVLNASRSPSATAGYHTADYRVYLDTVTSVYEEASGHEPGTVSSTFREDIKFAPNVEEEIKVSPTTEGEANGSFTMEEVVKVSPTLVLEEEANVSSTLEEEAAAPSVSLEGEVNVVQTVEDEDNIASTTEDKVAPKLEEEEGNVGPNFEEENNVASTLEEEDNVAPTLKEEDNVPPTIEEEDNVPPTIEEEDNVPPTIEEEDNIPPTLEEEDNVPPTLEEEDVPPILAEKDNVPPALEEEANISATLEEEANVPPALEAFTISPLNSQTSQWALLSTTTGPQESLNELEYSHETSSMAASDSPQRTKSTAATVKTTTTTTTTTAATSTTTHWSRRTWSPATTTPRVLHEIPPVDHGLLDVEMSLTQPPTLLILPNERAAVGGAGKASDACEVDPCLNGGTCTDQGGQIKCLCLPTYGGDFCQWDLERCEPGWDKFHGFCYRHFSQRLSWEVAEQHCRMMGAHLVSIMTPEEQTYINSNYKEYQWTGLNDKTIEDDFRWSDGNPLLYENWYRGQPDSYFLSGEDCVVMVWHDDGRWSDVPCNYHLAYTCKKGTTSCGPPPKIRNASIFGKTRQRYETNAVVRYHCADGFQQRLNPLIRCLSGGIWERPQILCFPEAGGPTPHPEVTSLTDGNFAAAEDDFEATKETPQYWDIKF